MYKSENKILLIHVDNIYFFFRYQYNNKIIPRLVLLWRPLTYFRKLLRSARRSNKSVIIELKWNSTKDLSYLSI